MCYEKKKNLILEKCCNQKLELSAMSEIAV